MVPLNPAIAGSSSTLPGKVSKSTWPHDMDQVRHPTWSTLPIVPFTKTQQKQKNVSRSRLVSSQSLSQLNETDTNYTIPHDKVVAGWATQPCMLERPEVHWAGPGSSTVPVKVSDSYEIVSESDEKVSESHEEEFLNPSFWIQQSFWIRLCSFKACFPQKNPAQRNCCRIPICSAGMVKSC